MLKRRSWRWIVPVVTGVVALATAGTASGLLRDMAGHWAGPLVAALEAKGVIAGDSSGRFQPEGMLTRSQLAKLLAVGLGYEQEANLLAQYDSRFRDISSRHWARGYVESLAELGLVKGYSDDTFGPEDSVSRAQMAAILARAAGMQEQAESVSETSSPYADSETIPSWARGSVQVVTMSGLMTGFPDGTFRPDQAMTRAEAAVVLERLLAVRGAAFHLTGTLIRFDTSSLEGIVRDSLGQDRPFRMASGARYYRGGQPATELQVKALDQVWVVLGADGTGRFMDARFLDRVVTNVKVDGQRLTASPVAGGTETFTVQPGSPVFLNGRAVPLAAVNGAPEVYLAFDRVTGEVRVVDAVNAPVHGKYVGIDPATGKLLLDVNEDLSVLSVGADALFFLDGQRVELADLEVGQSVRIALDSTGAVTYLEAER